MILTNDGGVYYTTYKSNPGETEGDWIGPVTGLNTTQFYGADKKKNEDSYIAGAQDNGCLLYTSDAADERSSVDLGGRRIIKKKKKEDNKNRCMREEPTDWCDIQN